MGKACATLMGIEKIWGWEGLKKYGMRMTHG
jgi:hypothetical protein